MVFCLVDCNSFYASCHQIFRPDLRDKPVVVLSNNDGCIVARSKEAKKIGIPDLQPFFKIESLLRENNVTIFSSNYPLYGDISNRVMKTLYDYSPSLEVYSIDEMFLCLKGHGGSLESYGREMKERVWKEVRMPVGVGIAPSKTLAKVANHAAKHIPKCHGVCVLDEPQKWEWVMARLPSRKVWGVGSRISKRLGDMGIYNALDLARANPKAIRKSFNVCLERTVEELNGIACIELEDIPPVKKQIYATRSFGEKVTTLSGLQQSVSTHASRAAQKLRDQNLFATNLHVFAHTSPHESNFYTRSVTVKLPYPTDDTRLIACHARKAVESIYKPNHRFLKAGVGIIQMVSKDNYQTDLFCEGQSLKSDQMMQTLDQINQRFGRGALFLGSEGIKKQWALRQNYKSPAYTTNFKDVPVIRC